jgi:amidase
VIQLVRDRHVFSLSATAEPAARVPAGGTVCLETSDCFADQVRSSSDTSEGVDWEHINPATGPVYVDGVEPGDVLAVTVERIEVADQGVMAVSAGFGVLREHFSGTSFRIVPLRDGAALLPGGARVPLRPMIGVMGVAPAGEPVPCGSPGPHGGNMDTQLIGEGASVYLPVAAAGALLAAGDLHAAMGDGEICGTGVEVAGRITLRVDVRRDLALVNPVVETPEVVATVASAVTLDEAADLATRDMAELLRARLGLSIGDATMLMSAGGQLRVSQVVDPLKTARFEMSKEILACFATVLV